MQAGHSRPSGIQVSSHMNHGRRKFDWAGETPQDIAKEPEHQPNGQAVEQHEQGIDGLVPPASASSVLKPQVKEGQHVIFCAPQEHREFVRSESPSEGPPGNFRADLVVCMYTAGYKYLKECKEESTKWQPPAECPTEVS